MKIYKKFGFGFEIELRNDGILEFYKITKQFFLQNERIFLAFCWKAFVCKELPINKFKTEINLVL